MKPTFRLLLVSNDKNTDITGWVADRLIELAVTDKAGVTADTLELRLDNRDGAIKIPPTGTRLQVEMGYEGEPLCNMGRYTVDEIVSSGKPRALTLKGKAADMKAGFKSQKKRAWHRTTIGKIVETIAKEQGLNPAVSRKFADIGVAHLDQLYDSDMNLLSGLAKKYGAIMKPAGGSLLFVERGAGVRADGQPLPTTPILPTETIEWRVSVAERQFYARVNAHWRDKRKAAVLSVDVGSGDPVTYLRDPYSSEAEATAAASARLRELARGHAALSITLAGKPAICAEMPIQVSVGDPLADGEWIVEDAEHRLNQEGLVSKLAAQRRGEFKEKEVKESKNA